MKTISRSKQCTRRSAKRQRRSAIKPAGISGKTGFSQISPPKQTAAASHLVTTTSEQIEASNDVKIVDAIVTDAGDQYLRFEQGNLDKWVKRIAFARGGSGSQEGITLLRKANIAIFSHPAEKDLLERVVLTTSFRQLNVIEKPGWTGGNYTLQNGSTFSPGDQEIPPIVCALTTGRIGRLGTPVSWRGQLASIFTGHPIGEMVLAAAFVPPVMEILGLTGNFGIDLNGPSGSGKSHLQYVAASVYGPSACSGANYRHTLNATINGIEQLLPYHNGALLVMDEMGLLPGKSHSDSNRALFELVMRLGHGDPKRRIGDPIGDGVSYRCVWLTSSNRTLDQLLEGRDSAEIDAATARVLTLKVPVRASGIFEYMPTGFTDLASVCSHIRGLVNQHHGTAIRRFLQKLVNERASNPDALIARIRAGMETLKSRIDLHGLAGHNVTKVEHLALIASVGLLAQRYRVLPRAFDPISSVLSCYGLMAATHQRPTTIIDRLATWLRGNAFYDLRIADLPVIDDLELQKNGAFVAHGVGKLT